MPQSRLHAKCDEHAARVIAATLESAFEDIGLPISAFEDPESPETWAIAVYCETGDADQVREEMSRIIMDAGYNIGLEQEDIPETDWVAATLQELSAVRAGRYIVHGSHERHVPCPNEISVMIDAGMAFGTGHHGTTAGCLDMLTRTCKRRNYYNVLDLGTGSGVLAIAAAKTMPASVLATDIDPVATETTIFNSRRNGVQGQVECVTSTGFDNRRLAEKAPFDLVVANILAKPLQKMARNLALHTQPGGTVILSGLLPHQRAPLIAAFRLQGLHFEHYHIRDNWLTLVFHKP
ncbi:MAG: 50S ribosomal protein L11 methyltransferase [Rhizobiaceae bacterium]